MTVRSITFDLSGVITDHLKLFVRDTKKIGLTIDAEHDLPTRNIKRRVPMVMTFQWPDTTEEAKVARLLGQWPEVTYRIGSGRVVNGGFRHLASKISLACECNKSDSRILG